VKKLPQVIPTRFLFYRCNLVVAFDPPPDFHAYAQYKVKAKSQKTSFFVIFSDVDKTSQLVSQLAVYQVTENRLKTRCTLKGPNFDEISEADKEDDLVPPFITRLPRLSPDGSPVGEVRPAATLKTSVFFVNRYCAKLPSDTL
jgi:hypothetical protein